ncbi:imidazole glycerol phosphate synthase subunit HisH [Kangiella spongicola]|uniref:Imidazole glycerol phosphate synthase subunit HisH n=1 Tax=Kangiella spongicola TaxID=796379 RepID=A0A318D845_9GAMM|nr:imidazole glycerol phosphate synthase subunit HisH [Kangiella spongicola]PXF63037.1 imidazole glycerol phosphate synthase subunit HisH [Kangiella spongicola]
MNNLCKVAIVDYGAGNIGSVQNMLKRVGAESCLAKSRSDILSANLLILPGVGSFDYGIMKLRESKLLPYIEEAVFQNKIPILGICLGMQLLTKGSDEGGLPGLGWIDAYAHKIERDDMFRVPHMGWNIAKPIVDIELTKGLHDSARFYFVHSYEVHCESADNILFKTNYGTEFSSGIYKDNIFGVQFHPEKSHKFGMQLLRNFIGYSNA